MERENRVFVFWSIHIHLVVGGNHQAFLKTKIRQTAHSAEKGSSRRPVWRLETNHRLSANAVSARVLPGLHTLTSRLARAERGSPVAAGCPVSVHTRMQITKGVTN